MNKLSKSQKGLMLIASILASSSLMVLSLGLWTQAMSFWRASEDNLVRMEAFHLAESGLDQAIVNLEADISYSGNGGYAYEKSGVALGSFSTVIETPNPANPFMKRITSTGITPDRDGSGRGVAARTIISMVRLVPPQAFDYAFFADEGITLAGSPSVSIDSYDSNFAAYNALTAKSTADVGTNAAGVNSIELNGNVTIKGNASVGPGANLNDAIYVGPNSTITGTEGSLLAPKTYTESTIPKSAVPMGNVVLDANQRLTLNGGTYVMDSLNISGKALLTVAEPTTIYIKNASSIAGNGVASKDDRPRNLIIHVVNGAPISYSGNGNLYGAIYAPESAVSVSGNGQVYGAVISNTYNQSGNGQFHFDEDLKNPDTSSNLRAEIVSWQESNKYLSTTASAGSGQGDAS